MPPMVAGLTSLLLLSTMTFEADAQCKPQKLRIEQENYQLLADKTYAYVEDINSSGSAGWGAFTVRVLYGQFGSPFILPKGFMRKADVDKTIARRSDIVVQTIAVASYDPKKPSQKNLGKSVTVKLEGNKTVTVRVADVQPVMGFRSVDFLYLEVCGP